MKFRIFFRLILFLKITNATSTCFSQTIDTPNMCFSCFHSNFYNGSLKSPPFPASDCQLKQNIQLHLKILVLAPSSTTICEECSSKFIIVQRSLEAGLIYVSENCKGFMACEVLIYLEASGDEKPHIYIDSLTTEHEYFRRSRVKLILRPLDCGILDLGVPCASVPSFYQRVLIKSPSLKLFISESIYLERIFFDGSDLYLNSSKEACWNITKCCSSSRINSPGDACNPKYSELQVGSFWRSSGLFNLEILVDDPAAPTPSLIIDSCVFFNFYVSGYILGFTALIKSVGYSFFNLTITSSIFENIFFIEAFLTTESKPETILFDPVYAGFSYKDLKKLFRSNFDNSNGNCGLYIKGLLIKNYNSNAERDLAKASYLSAAIFQLEKSCFNSIFIDNINLDNINNQRIKQLYLIIFTPDDIQTVFTLKNCLATMVNSSIFIFLADTSNVVLFNISIFNWVQSYDGALLYFQNVSLLRVEGLFVSSVLSKSFETPAVLVANCLLSQISNFKINNSLGLTVVEILNTSASDLSQIFVSETQYRNHLFYSDYSVFTISKASIVSVSAFDPDSNIIFSFRSPIFNISFIYINGVSAQALFNYLNADSVTIDSLLIENVISIRTFFLSTTTFYKTLITNLTFLNSITPRFSEFIDSAAFWTYRPVMKIMDSKFINLTLPALNSDFWLACVKIELILRNCIFESVKRVDQGIISPWAIIYVARKGKGDFENCSFKSVGYTFITRQIQILYNYNIIFFGLIEQYSVRYCVFESDETVSLNSGFLVSSQISISAEITNCKFFVRKKNPNLIYKGGFFLHSPFMNFVNNSFINLTCTPYHMYSHILRSGMILILGEDSLSFISNTKSAEIHNNSFENCNCENGGAMHTSNYHKMNISNIFFQNNYAYSGGSLGIVSSSSMSVINVTVLLSQGYEAASIFLYNLALFNITNYFEAFTNGYSTGSWKVTKSYLLCNHIKVFNASSDYKGGFGTLLASSVKISRGLIINSSAVEYGGTFLISIESSLVLNEMFVTKTAAKYGGFVSGDDAILILIKNSTVNEALASLNGACFFFDLVLSSSFENLTILSSYSTNGIIYIKTDDQASVHIFSKLTCLDNKAAIGSCIFFHSSSSLQLESLFISGCLGKVLTLKNELPCSITIHNLTAKNLSNLSSLLEVEGQKLNISEFRVQNSYFNNNIIILKKSKVSITNIYFSNNSGPQQLHCIVVKSSNLSIDGLDFFNFKEQKTDFLNSESSYIIINNANLEGASGTTAVIYLEKTRISAENVYFKQNFITCLSAFKSDVRLRNIEFLNNKAAQEQDPSNILIKNKVFEENTVFLENLQFLMNSPGLACLFHSFKYLIFLNCSFFALNNNSFLSAYYQGIIITDIAETGILESKFAGFLSKVGSAARVFAIGEFLASIQIKNSIFLNCCSVSGGGGAFSFSNLNQTAIIDCFFSKNQALLLSMSEEANSGIGGCGLILCYPFNANQRYCLIKLVNNSYIDNYSYLYGPLIVTNSTISSKSDLVNRNNSDANSFSNSLGEFPPKVYISLPVHDIKETKVVDLEEYNNTLLYNLETSKSILEVRSGKPFGIEILLTDNDDKILTFDNNSSCTIANPLFSNRTTIIKKGFVLASQGRFNFSNLTLIDVPATRVSLSVFVKIPKDMVLNPDPLSYNFTVEFSFKPCVRGEIIKSDFSCFRCPEGKFSYMDPMIGFIPNEVATNPQKCEVCSEVAVCPGGQYNFPRPNYWRPAQNGSKFLECFIPEACEGPGNFSLEDLKGKCAKGHYGNLCNDCLFGFGKLNSNFLCEPCSETNKGAITRMVFAVIFLFLYAAGGSYMYSVQDSEIEKHGFLFVYVKISVNFTQLITLLTFMKFTWVLPTIKKFFSSTSNSVSLATEDVLLNDCILQANITEIDNLYAVKLIFIVFLPVILGFLTSAFWVGHYAIQKIILRSTASKNQMADIRKLFYIRVLASFIISVFLFHPLIIRSCFNMFNCFQLDEDLQNSHTFLFVYPNFRCWTHFHYKVIFLFAIPGITIWGLLFPALLLYVLFKQQNFRFLKSSKIQKKCPNPLNFDGRKLIPVDVSLDTNSILQNPGSLTSDNFREKGNLHLPSKKKTIFKIILKSNIFKFLYYGYKEEFTYWECFNFLKKLLISLLINLNQIIGYDIIVLLIFGILTLSFLMQNRHQPFVRDDLNFLENFSLISVFFTFVSIVMLSTILPSGLQYIFALVILLLYLIFYTVIVFYIIKTIRETKLLQILWDSFLSSLYPKPLGKKTDKQSKCRKRTQDIGKILK